MNDNQDFVTIIFKVENSCESMHVYSGELDAERYIGESSVTVSLRIFVSRIFFLQVHLLHHIVKKYIFRNISCVSSGDKQSQSGIQQYSKKDGGSEQLYGNHLALSFTLVEGF